MLGNRRHARYVAALHGFFLLLLTLLFEIPGVFARIALVRGLFGFGSFFGQLTTALANLQRSLTNQQPIEPTIAALSGPFALLNLLAAPLGQLVGWGPLVFALLTAVFLPGGFLLTRWALGARKPSTRERQVMYEALSEATKDKPATKGPSAFYVLDNQTPLAYTIGTTLYINSGLLSEQRNRNFLHGLLAHELGHRNSYDGQLILALRRLVLPPIYYISRSLGTVAPGTLVYSIGAGNASGCLAGAFVFVLSAFLSLAGGGFGAWLLTPLWQAYWRKREYAADQFAQELGADGPLQEFLQQHTVQDVATPYYLSAAPSNELRLDRLQYGPERSSSMPWPKRETLTLAVFGVLACVAIVIGPPMWSRFAYRRQLAAYPRLIQGAWQRSDVRNESVIYYFGPNNQMSVSNTSGYTAYGTYTFGESNTDLIMNLSDGQPQSYFIAFPDGQLALTSYSGGSQYRMELTRTTAPPQAMVFPTAMAAPSCVEQETEIQQQILGTWRQVVPADQSHVVLTFAPGCQFLPSYWSEGTTYYFETETRLIIRHPPNMPNEPDQAYDVSINGNQMTFKVVGSGGAFYVYERQQNGQSNGTTQASIAAQAGLEQGSLVNGIIGQWRLIPDNHLWVFEANGQYAVLLVSRNVTIQEGSYSFSQPNVLRLVPANGMSGADYYVEIIGSRMRLQDMQNSSSAQEFERVEH